MKLEEGVPNVARMNVFGMQVCVPKEFTDDQIIAFAEQENPAGTSTGWFIIEDMGRVQCQELAGHHHIVLEV